MNNNHITQQTKALIDGLKSICATFGLGNDGNEFKIITQAFLYKYMNDKFIFVSKQKMPDLAKSKDWHQSINQMDENKYTRLLMLLGGNTPKLQQTHLLANLMLRQQESQFAKLLDDTLRDIARMNADVFSVKTESGARIQLFDEFSNYITDGSRRDGFCKAVINQLGQYSFESVFSQKFDFFSTIFEYLIGDYNKDGGGKYAEYYTPHAVARIIAKILVPSSIKNVSVYDPAAGSGSLLMSIAHEIGEDKCAIYSQDISQKSSGMLRLNLILNDLAHSIENIIQGNTLSHPYHRNGNAIKTFDFVVSNPPFKLDFSEFRGELDTPAHRARFFAGIPNVPGKDKDKMAIYLVFIQHIMFSLSIKGKAAIVVPTGFLTAQSGIEKKIREKLVDEKMLRGVVSMPSNIFATTGTNVSILFLDKANTQGDIVLMDASKLGTTVKEGKNQKTLLSADEEQRIITTFNLHQPSDDFSVVVSYEQIKDKNYSFSAGQYFDVKIEYTDITPKQFAAKMDGFKQNLDSLFAESKDLEKEIKKQLGGLKYEN